MFTVKIWIIIFVSLIVTQTAISQTYEKMLDTNKQWNVLLGSFPPFGGHLSTQSLKILGDTIIDGEICKKTGVTYDQITPYSLSNLIMHEDSSGNVYGVVFNTQSQTYEKKVMYNFNLNVGDTITPYSGWGDFNTFGVLNVDTAFFAQKFRKRIAFGFIGTTDTTEYWYEGVGSSFGLTYPGCLIIDLSFSLLCFYENNSLLYNDDYFVENNCWVDVSVPSTPLENKEIFRPNPASDFIYLKEDNDIIQCTIYDINGKIIISTINTNTIDVSKLKQGIYLIHFLTKNQNYIQKLLICRD